MPTFTNQDIDDFNASIEAVEVDREREHFCSPLDVVDSMFEKPPVVPTADNIGNDIEFGEGELTIWGGGAGSGKSLLLGDVINRFLVDHDCAIASLEMPLRETLRRMMIQTFGRNPIREEAHEWAQTRGKSLWLYDQLDTVPAARIISMVKYAHMRLGATHVVIDSLTKCGLPQDGNGFLTQQTAFVDELQRLVKHLGIHVHLVAHLRKTENGRKDMHSIRGASQITDLADRVLLLVRNFEKERVLEEARRIPQEYWSQELADKVDKVEKQSDAKLQCEKQRSNGYIGDVRLLFEPSTLRHRVA